MNECVHECVHEYVHEWTTLKMTITIPMTMTWRTWWSACLDSRTLFLEASNYYWGSDLHQEFAARYHSQAVNNNLPCVLGCNPSVLLADACVLHGRDLLAPGCVFSVQVPILHASNVALARSLTHSCLCVQSFVYWARSGAILELDGGTWREVARYLQTVRNKLAAAHQGHQVRRCMCTFPLY